MPDQNKFFAYFDILGFRNLVNDIDLKNIVKLIKYKFIKQLEYDRLINHLHPTQAKFAKLTAVEKLRKNVKFFTFSDTVLFYVEGDDFYDLASLYNFITLFFGQALNAGLPIRGAIDFGELYCEQKNDFFLGKGIINAYDYAENQEWAGIILTPECENKIKNDVEMKIIFEDSKYNMLYINYKVPCKRESKNKYFTVNWVSAFESMRNKNLTKNNILPKKEFRYLFIKNHPNYKKKGKIEIKIENTYKYYFYIHQHYLESR